MEKKCDHKEMMKVAKELSMDFIKFVNKAPSPHHVVGNIIL